MYDKIVEVCKNNNKNFIYAYCPEPDRSMHNYGTDDKKVIEIMTNSDLRKSLSKKSREFILNNFSWKNVGELWDKVIHEVVS